MAQLNKTHPIVQLQSSADHLEPRVAKVETGLDMLTRDVASLAQVVREQGVNIERQIRELAVGVTQAAAPRKTDWQTLIALVMLIMAIGSAVFWPLNQTANDNKQSLQHMEQQFHAHTQLQLHPVFLVPLDRWRIDSLGSARPVQVGDHLANIDVRDLEHLLCQVSIVGRKHPRLPVMEVSAAVQPDGPVELVRPSLVRAVVPGLVPPRPGFTVLGVEVVRVGHPAPRYELVPVVKK